MYKRIVIDLEANDLLEPMLDFTQRPLRLKDTAKLWCTSVRCIDTDKSFLMVPEELLEEHKEALSSITAVPLSRENLAKMVHNHVEEVIGHNIIKYDLPVLQLFGVIDYSIGYPDSTIFGKKVRIIDTLLLSKLSNADRLGGHSLKNFGKQGDNQKIEFHDFSKFSPEMAIYCDMDTIVNKDAYFYLMKEMGEGWEKYFLPPYLMEAKLADLTLQQELFGFHYDAELSKRNKKELDELLEERYNKVSPNIPPRPLNKTESKRFTPPAIKTIGNLSYNSKVEGILQAIGATYLSEAEVFTYKGKEYPLSYLKGIEKYIPPAKVHTKSGSLTAAAKKFLASIGSEYNPINDSFEFEGRDYPMTYQGCVLEILPEPDVVLSSHMTAFLERIGASYDPATHKYTFEGREYSLDYEECVKETLEADIKDLAHIKWYLTELGWEPSQWNMRDLTRDIHKKVLPRDKFEETVRRYASSTMESPFKALRLKLLELPESITEEQLYNFLINKDTKMLKVPTTPPLRVGATKELCPNLSKLAEDSHIEFIKDLVEFYTYQHRRNSIGGGLDEEGEESKGFESYIRADGRISTPVDTLGTSTSRMSHKIVCNLPRVSSLYGEKMRALFCAGPDHIQYGFDFASLEAMIEGHYVLQYPGGEEMLADLLAEKPNSIHCFSDDTEILTPLGWKYIKDLNNHDLVSQWDSNSISFVKPSRVVNRPYKGKMISIKSKKTDQLLTPEHRVIYKDPRSTKWKVTEAKDFISVKSSRNLPRHGCIVNTKSTYNLDFLRLLVAVQADAYLMKDCSGIRFQFQKKSKKDRLLRILGNLGIKFTFKEKLIKEEVSSFIIYLNSSPETEQIRTILNKDKSFPNSFYTLSFDEIKTIVDEIQYWDGTVTSNGDIVLDTTSKQTIVVLQTLCHLIGLSATYTEFDKTTTKGECHIFRCYISKSNPNLTTDQRHYKEIDYEGNVVCVTVPSGFIMVKRNNKIFVSGNCKMAKKLQIDRSSAKAISYGLLYGASVKKISEMLKIPMKKAEKIYNDYWEAVPALTAFKEAAEREWELSGRKTVVAGDGRKLRVRSKHSILNVLLQSLGSLCMKQTYVFLMQKLEAEGHLVNMFKDDAESIKNKVSSMIIYHKQIVAL